MADPKIPSFDEFSKSSAPQGGVPSFDSFSATPPKPAAGNAMPDSWVPQGQRYSHMRGGANGPSIPMHGENLPETFGGTLMSDAMNAPRGFSQALMHPLDTLGSMYESAKNLPSNLSTDIDEGKWGKLGARGVEMLAPFSNPEAMQVVGGAAKGGFRGAMAPSTMKIRGLPLELPVPASVSAGSVGAGIGGLMGHGPGAMVGGAVGALTPIVRGALKGGSEAYRELHPVTMDRMPLWRSGGLAPADIPEVVRPESPMPNLSPRPIMPDVPQVPPASRPMSGIGSPYAPTTERTPLWASPELRPADIEQLTVNNGPMPRGLRDTSSNAINPQPIPFQARQPLWKGVSIDPSATRGGYAPIDPIQSELPSGRFPGRVIGDAEGIDSHVENTPMAKPKVTPKAKPTASAPPATIQPPADDLSSQLQQSIDEAQKNKAFRIRRR